MYSFGPKVGLQLRGPAYLFRTLFNNLAKQLSTPQENRVLGPGLGSGPGLGPGPGFGPGPGLGPEPGFGPGLGFGPGPGWVQGSWLGSQGPAWALGPAWLGVDWLSFCVDFPTNLGFQPNWLNQCWDERGYPGIPI